MGDMQLKTRLILFHKDSVGGGIFLNFLNFLLFSVEEISLQDPSIDDKVRDFQNGNDILFEFTTDKLPKITDYLSTEGFDFSIDN